MKLSILDLTKSINTLDYIAEKTSKKLENIGIKRIIDLLFYFPINIIQRNFCKSITDIKLKESNVIILKVKEYIKTPKTTKVICIDNKGEKIEIILFKVFKNYLEKYLKIEEEVLIIATAENYGGKVVFYHPEKILHPNKIASIKKIDTIYKRHQDITSNKFQNYIGQALKILEACEIIEWQDNTFLKENNFPSFKDALFKIHNPNCIEDIALDGKNTIRLAIDEIINYHFTLIKSREGKEESKGIKFNITNELIKLFMKDIPFALTEDQIKAIQFLKQDLEKDIQATTLIQGDVGSGKTIVCFISSLFAIESSYQVAFMAPTEILAIQHYHSFTDFAKNLGINIALLKGKETAKNKEKITLDLQEGNIDIIIGTHALIQDTVKFKNLGLVIVDEQHKFGVNQRLTLLNKGSNPNLILTTATPIPRTLSIALYGDIKSFEIKEKPKNRKEIITRTISSDRIEEVLSAALRALEAGEKIYWVCPLIEISEKLDLSSSINRYDFLKRYIPEEKLFLLHGKLKTKEKDEIINTFKEQDQSAILVSTTVVEVGVDIAQCNIMIIENAQHYGLSQLHQLRGRVGRGEKQGICILLYDKNISNTSKKRLSVIKNSNDGFYISEKDLEIRGFGDVLGTMQSGFEYFRVVNLNEHGKYLVPCIKYAKLLHQSYLEGKNLQGINQLTKIFAKSQENLNKLG